MLFDGCGTTFSGFVLEQRLARARQMLTDRRHARQGRPAPLLAQVGLAAERLREVPGVHPDVGRVELVDRLVHRLVAGVRVAEHPPGGIVPRCVDFADRHRRRDRRRHPADPSRSSDHPHRAHHTHCHLWNPNRQDPHH